MGRQKNRKRAKIVYNGKHKGRHEWLIIDLTDKPYEYQYDNVHTTRKSAEESARNAGFTIEK